VQFEAGVRVDEVGEVPGVGADLVDERAEAAASEGFEGDGEFEDVGSAGGAQGPAEQVGQSGLGVVVGVEVVGVLPQGGEIVGVPDGEEAGGDRLPAEFVQVEGDGVGGVEAGEHVPVPVAEEEASAVGGVHVEPGAVGGAAGGDVVQRVDVSGVGGAGGGGDEQRSGQAGEGLVERVGVERAAGGGYGDGFGQPEQPGGAGQRVVGVGPVHEPDGSAVGLPGEEQGELVGFGAAGGDEGVGFSGPAAPVDLAGQCCREEPLQFRGSRCLVPGVQGGVEGGGGEVGCRGDGERGAVEVGGAQGVGRVGGGLGEGVDQGAEGVRVALVGEDVANRRSRAGRDRLRATCRQRSAPCPGSGVQRFEDGVEQRPQGVGAFGS
jgi:hypothetical protein